MAESAIEWTAGDDGSAGMTWNPVVGCSLASPGCKNCYAIKMAHRLEAMGRPEYVGLTTKRNGRAVWTDVLRCLPDRLSQPLKWKKPRRVFVNSMSDLFHPDVPTDFIWRVWHTMTVCPQHTFQVLTKRPDRMADVVAEMYAQNPHLPVPPNVWLGTSVEDQQRAAERIPHLLRCPAAVRFLSCEPMLENLDLSAFFGGQYVGLPGDKVHPNYNFGIDWVIVGGESGANARPCDVEWVRGIVRQCRAARVACFVKQLGAWPIAVNRGPEMPMRWVPDDSGEAIDRWYRPLDKKGGDPSEWPDDLRVREFPR